MEKSIPCARCNIKKPINAFYVSTISSSGNKGLCKPCVRKRTNTNNREPHRVAFFSSEAGKLAAKKNFRNYLSKYSNRHNVRMAVAAAINRGDLVRSKSCEECGVIGKIEAHHNDYSKTLEVRWLCKSCHCTWHNHNTPIYHTH